MRHVLICGSSARAAAASAARAGFRVTTIDAFADADRHPAVRALSIVRDFRANPTAAGMARASREIACDLVSYTSPFENHPHAVQNLAAGRRLWGNSPDVLRRVRDPFLLARILSDLGFVVPRVSNGSDDPNDSNAAIAWLVKPFRSGGGRRVAPWDGGSIPATSYLQQRIDGVPASVVFVAAEGSCAPLVLSRQLVGDANFGAAGYRYCGSIMSSLADEQFPGAAGVFDKACALARRVSAAFGLRGINGIDFIASDDAVYPVEVNPRWSASAELAERAFGLSCFAAHAAACDDAAVPAFELGSALTHMRAVGKAIVYARRSGCCGDTRAWIEDESVADVPRPGDSFRAGQPVCTVFATAADGAACYRALCERAARVYAELNEAVDARRRVSLGRIAP